MREYSLNGLQLHMCVRAYAAIAGVKDVCRTFQAVVVIQEDKPWLDRVVYLATSSRDCTEAVEELKAMIEAAKVLRGI